MIKYKPGTMLLCKKTWSDWLIEGHVYIINVYNYVVPIGDRPFPNGKGPGVGLDIEKSEWEVLK